jgi:hypothetical protein
MLAYSYEAEVKVYFKLNDQDKLKFQVWISVGFSEPDLSHGALESVLRERKMDFTAGSKFK